MVLRLHDHGMAELVARATVVVGPPLAFQTFPTRGAFSIAMIVPAVVLGIAHLRRGARRVPIWELALAALMTSSVAWGDEPAYTDLRLRSFLPVLLATVAAANLLEPREVLRCLKLSFVVMVGSALVYIAIFPSARYSDGYTGLAIHGQYPKNGLGALLVFAILLLVASPLSLASLFIPALVVLLILTKSTTAWLVALAIVSVVVGLRSLARQQVIVNVSNLALFAATAFGLVILVLLFADAALLSLVGKDPTLTSRTEIWAACWPEIKKAPFLGHGAFTFLDTDSQSPVTLRIWSHFSATYLPPHPHNGLLDLWGQLGLAGVVAFVGLAVRLIRAGLDGARHQDRTSLTGLLGFTFVLLYGITESSYLGSWLVVTVCCAAIADRGNLRSSPPARGEGSDVCDEPEPTEPAEGRHRAITAHSSSSIA